MESIFVLLGTPVFSPVSHLALSLGLCLRLGQSCRRQCGRLCLVFLHRSCVHPHSGIQGSQRTWRGYMKNLMLLKGKSVSPDLKDRENGRYPERAVCTEAAAGIRDLCCPCLCPGSQLLILCRRTAPVYNFYTLRSLQWRSSCVF